MIKLLKPLSLASLSLGFCLATLAAPAGAQQSRAYAPEDLHSLSYQDQVRVISLEYSEQSNGGRIPDDQLRFYIDQIHRSTWTFSQVKADISKSLASGPVLDPPQLPGDNIRCESVDGRAQSCRTPWPGHSRLVRQLSNSTCDEGRTWNSQRGVVYVDEGCRADFAPAAVATPTPGTFRCENVGSRYNTCAAPWRGQSRLGRQLSTTPCIEGRSWGSTAGNVWVAQGCRGEFIQATSTLPKYSVTCVSAGGAIPTTCAWDRRKGRPYVAKQLSKARCIEKVTWGYKPKSGVWVSAGCRARFGAR